jgi:hypothetical protein
MKKRFKGQFNSMSCNSLLKTIDASIDHRGAKNAKIRVITKLPNSEQSYKGKVKTHKYINKVSQQPEN